MTNPEYTVESLLQAIDQLPSWVKDRARELAASSPKPAQREPEPSAEPVAFDISSMVNRFLGWPLPRDFSPDCGISFKPTNNLALWPTGTNLFTADQAKAMFEYVIATTSDVRICANCDSTMPEGCEHTFKGEPECALNGGLTYSSPPASDREQAPSEGQKMAAKTCPECGAELLVECIACSYTTFPQHSGTRAVTDADVHRALNSRVPGGAQVKNWLPILDDRGEIPSDVARTVVRTALESFAATLPAGDEQMRRDAERHMWWRENYSCIEEDEAGLHGVAFSYQLPILEMAGPDLFDMIADTAIAAKASCSVTGSEAPAEFAQQKQERQT